MLKLGVVGLGGYAGYVCNEVLEASAAGDPIRFVAACDPYPANQAQRRDQLLGNRVAVLSDLNQLLHLELDAVWLPVPIHLHRPFTEQALAAGKPVMVEKPAAGCLDDVDAMIAARDRAALPVCVGFQNLYEPNAWTVKGELLAGRIGQIKRASVFGCWPRSQAYYGRTAWAGRISREGAWVLDSPLNNALAHFVNLALFLLGSTAAASALPAAVEAELFRAYPIEMFDTCNIRTTLDSGLPLSVAMTHACRRTVEPIVTIQGSRGSVRFLHETNTYEFLDPAGRVSESLTNNTGLVRQTLQSFARFMDGDQTAPVATLEHSRAHTLLVNAVSEAADVVDVSELNIENVIDAYGHRTRAITGIEDALAHCAARGELLAESDIAVLRSNVGHLDLTGYHCFHGPRVAHRPREAGPLVANA